VTSRVEVDALAREAASVLAGALAEALHLPGARERHRAALERSIALCEEVARAASQAEVAHATRVAARLTEVQAHCARAEDARHGANQLSQGAQRAPTHEDCEDGWQRVAGIVATAEDSARAATRIAAELDHASTPHARAKRAAQRAEVAARAARLLVEDRNHAYTFHADPAFSFGEGWYVAAAARLCGTSTQIEPGPAQAAVERFLRDAGLGPRIVPYRPRPRANKALPDLIARAFAEDPRGTQRSLRDSFLGEGPIPRAIEEFGDRVLASAASEPAKKVLVWVRRGTHHAGRNSTHAEVGALCRCALDQGLLPILMGDVLAGSEPPPRAIDMTMFYRGPPFDGRDTRRAQLQLFEHLRRAHGVLGQVGVTTAGMDGPALMGLPTMYLTEVSNVRMRRWVGTVPNYEEVVRADGYLERIGHTLSRWKQRSGEEGSS
jgi:hypothetical protein